MGDNNEQEAADLAAMNDDDDDDTLLEVIYRGDQLVNIPNVPFRLIIHASVTEIDEDACRRHNFRMLTEVVFHNKVIIIGQSAFDGCSQLLFVVLPVGLLRLEDCAFDGCTFLREIVIPASVQYMGDGVFYGCRSLERVVFAPRTTSIELGSHMFFVCTNLQFVTLPSNLRLIPWGCFQHCILLTHFHIPGSVTEIGASAFASSGLRSITIPETVQQIDSRAFEDCEFLVNVSFHSTNLTMANNIFANCPALSVIKIYPWMWPTVFASMQEHPDFIFKFFRDYQTQILDVETPDVSARLFRRLRRDRKRTATMMDD